MHEIRATVSAEQVAETARLANVAGIDQISVSDVVIVGSSTPRKIVSVETSTPQARAFVDAFLNSPVLSQTHYTLTSREVRAIVNDQSPADLTRPVCEPFPDVIQDLWQLSHVTPSYIARAAAGAVLLATGIIENNPVAIVVAALFLPFLSQVLAVSFGVWSRDRKLMLHGLRALLISTILALAGGAAVALLQGGPVQFEGFKNPLTSFALSALIGITAGLSSADDTGRRYLIGVAASVQLAIFPVWFGAAAVLGLPSHDVLQQRLTAFLINLFTISAAAVASYAALHLRAGGGWAAPRSGR